MASMAAEMDVDDLDVDADAEEYARDVEALGSTGGEGSYSSVSTSSSSGGLQQRKRAGLGRSSPSKASTQVIHDLEKIGVKPSPVVSRAVTMIDSWTLLTGRCCALTLT